MYGNAKGSCLCPSFVSLTNQPWNIKREVFDRSNIFRNFLLEKDVPNLTLSCRFMQFRPTHSCWNIFVTKSTSYALFPTEPFSLLHLSGITATLYLRVFRGSFIQKFHLDFASVWLFICSWKWNDQTISLCVLWYFPVFATTKPKEIRSEQVQLHWWISVCPCGEA